MMLPVLLLSFSKVVPVVSRGASARVGCSVVSAFVSRTSPRNNQLPWRAMSSSTSSDQVQNNVISSTKSNTVKKIQGLLNKRKKRVELGQTIVEGPRMVFDLLDNLQTRSLVQQVFVSVDEYEGDYQSRLADTASSSSETFVQLVTPPVLKACSDTVTPQGIVALVDIPTFDNISPPPSYPLYLVLDGVSDPGNIGTLLRSSLAVGVAGVVLLPECCDVWNPKAVRSAMGASFQLPIVQVSSWQEALERLQQDWNVDTSSVYAATMMEESDNSQGSRPHFDIDWLVRPTALVIGSEGNGLSPEIRQALEHKTDNVHRIKAVHVPMQSGIESLNAAVCGSVILFEYARQCQQVETKSLQR
jgi:tRNA G18 (ribose-2'-O)-methylase SpoU